jgi:uncharacterized surface protein with fasciclin (FAS1) repeats
MKKTQGFVLSMMLLAGLALPQAVSAGPMGPSIVDVAIEANDPGGAFEGQLDVLIAALQAADPAVLETLDGNGQFTVFAPTDDAFGNLGLDEFNVGTAFPQADLTQILLYHVARGERDAADVTSSSRIRTLQRGFLMVSGTMLTDLVDRNANIVFTDVYAANGVIHVIDEVVLPFMP